MAPREVLAKHTSHELSEWAAYFKLEEIDQKQAQDKQKLQSQVAKQPRRPGRR